MTPEWMTEGKCRVVAWDVFFPRDGTGASTAPGPMAPCRTESLPYVA